MALTSLVVCADAKAVQVLSRILREMGIRAEHCGDPHEAAVRLAKDHFDALLIDCVNEVAAKELIVSAKATTANKDTLIIAILDTSNHVREMFAQGADFVLYKPVSHERAGNSLRAARSLMPNERRRRARVPAYGPVSIAYATSENVPANLVDLSQDGVAIRAERALPPFCKVYFEFKLPAQVSVVRLAGEVVWTDFTGRVGLQFSRVPQASRQLLDGWLRENLFRQLEAGMVPPQTDPGVPDLPPAKIDPTPDVAGNRRVQSRVTCSLGAEIYPLGSNVPHRCSLSDIGPGGCYVEMLSPLPAGTVIEIVVRTLQLKVRLKGKVRSTHLGFGMGVEFTLRTPDEREQVKQLMACQMPDSEVPVEQE